LYVSMNVCTHLHRVQYIAGKLSYGHIYITKTLHSKCYKFSLNINVYIVLMCFCLCVCRALVRLSRQCEIVTVQLTLLGQGQWTRPTGPASSPVAKQSYAHICTCANTLAHMHARTHAHMHARTHTYTPVQLSVPPWQHALLLQLSLHPVRPPPVLCSPAATELPAPLLVQELLPAR